MPPLRHNREQARKRPCPIPELRKAIPLPGLLLYNLRAYSCWLNSRAASADPTVPLSLPRKGRLARTLSHPVIFKPGFGTCSCKPSKHEAQSTSFLISYQVPCSAVFQTHSLSLACLGLLVSTAYKGAGSASPRSHTPLRVLGGFVLRGSSLNCVIRLCPLENITFPPKPILSTYLHVVLC